MNIPDNISEILETIFLIRIRDPESFWSWVQDPGWKKFGTGINIPDPQRCHFSSSLSLLGSLIYLPASHDPLTPLSIFQPSCCLWHVIIFFRSSRAAGEAAESGDWRHCPCLGSGGSYITTSSFSYLPGATLRQHYDRLLWSKDKI